jgi:hypothetical protein
MKRQRGRGRKPGGGGGGGGSHGNHGNRSLESNGPEVKIRGTAAQIYEKYAQYARDSQQGGDRVKYENYLQHAEHYFRIMAATMPRERVFQQQGEGGAPFQQAAQGEGGQPQPTEPESADALKVMDDQNSDDDDYENEDAEETREGEDVEAGAQDNQQGDNQQGDRQGRRRRRGRRRPNDGERNSPQGGAGGEGEQQQQPRSALDSLARRQGAIAGS